MRIAHAACVANAVEELEDLHGALAPETDRVAEAGGVHGALRAGAGLDDAGQLRDPLAGIEQVAYHLVDAAACDLLAQHRAHPFLGLVQGGGEIAHPRGIEAPGDEQRLELARQLLVGRREHHDVLGEMEPGAAAPHELLARKLLDQRPPHRRRYIGEAHAPQPPDIGAGLIGDLGVKAAEGGERTAP
ncbi:MAG TPA: hypothetical protein VNY70_06805 [Steroidobacteraceae bacterium]|nr:hypothetical protein [Steroidobacteraceae bacterium]